MGGRAEGPAELKRSVRDLKKLEIKIRFGGAAPEGKPGSTRLVWDEFFDLRGIGAKRAKHSLRELSAMARDEYKAVVAAFFFEVYFRRYRETGIMDEGLYDPALLSRLGLPPGSDGAAIKRRFHALALQCHPDAGGDAEKFIELMESYRKLIARGK